MNRLLACKNGHCAAWAVADSLQSMCVCLYVCVCFFSNLPIYVCIVLKLLLSCVNCFPRFSKSFSLFLSTYKLTEDSRSWMRPPRAPALSALLLLQFQLALLPPCWQKLAQLSETDRQQAICPDRATTEWPLLLLATVWIISLWKVQAGRQCLGPCVRTANECNCFINKCLISIMHCRIWFRTLLHSPLHCLLLLDKHFFSWSLAVLSALLPHKRVLAV